jgi:2-oxoglutarate ferredoxin oxidoreductase subunit delta
MIFFKQVYDTKFFGWTEKMPASKTLPYIDVKPTMCTGCEICVKVCPTDVLMMVAAPEKVEGALAAVKSIEKCTKCMLCEVNCPHFAIFVEPEIPEGYSPQTSAA